MEFHPESWAFWIAIIGLGLFLMLTFWTAQKYWHQVKWIRLPVLAVALLAAGFFLRGYYDERFGEPCPSIPAEVLAPQAPIIPPIVEQTQPSAPNTPESLEAQPPPQ